ncbi:Uncharacterised protein [Mycobacteroides abscessus subsp. abscessus]|nr:Uncharacterised protein [Mycobacteroides abscessus subsp. abscessus]
MIDRDRILAEPSRRLHHDGHIAECQCCDDDFAFGALRSIDEEVAWRRPPVLFDVVPQFIRQRREPPLVVGGADANRVGSQGLLGQPVGVLAAPVDDRVNQCVRVILGQTGNRVRTRFRADVVAHGAQGVQQAYEAAWCVEADGVTDTCVLGRVRRQHQCNPTIRGRDMP